MHAPPPPHMRVSAPISPASGRAGEGIRRSPSVAEIDQEPLEHHLSPQSQGSRGVCSKFFRRMVFAAPPTLPMLLLPPLFFFFFCSHLVNSASTPVIFYCVEVISTLSVKWKHMMWRVRP